MPLILIPKGWTNLQKGKAKDGWKWFEKACPALANHLFPYKLKAEKRCDKGDYWWELRACDYYAHFEKPKLMYLVFQVKPSFTFDASGLYSNNAVWITPEPDKYLLGILNSKIGWFLISKICTQIQGGYQLIYDYLRQIPIRKIDFNNCDDKSQHGKIVGLVDRILELNKRLAETKTVHEKSVLQRQIDATDRQIDQLVYELYDLTADEIKIVEESVK